MQKYIGKYAVYLQKTSDNKPTKNKYDNYLRHKTGQIYRFNKNTLVLYLNSTNSKNKYIPLLEQSGVELTPKQTGDTEYTFIFPEKKLDIVVQIINVATRGKHNYPNFE